MSDLPDCFEEEQQIVDANKKLIQLYQGKIKEKIDEVWGT